MRYKITLNYDGAAFNGWQVQPDAPSVQGELEKALSTLLKTPIQVTGAGRTDTGVSASAYVAHFDAPAEVDCADLRYKLNALLPSQVSVSGIEVAEDDFHARFDARERTYRYFIHREKDPFLAHTSYLCGYPGLDFELMNTAARSLLGTHDFSCFQKAGSDAKTSVCTVYGAAWRPYVPAICAAPSGDAPAYWYFEITADRFLRNMVRAIVGTLLEVGRGKRTLENFRSLTEPAHSENNHPSRCQSGESVPGNALFLVKVKY